MERWKARYYSCGFVRVSVNPGGPEASAKRHDEITDGEHDVRLEYHDHDPEDLPLEECQCEDFVPFCDRDIPKERPFARAPIGTRINGLSMALSEPERRYLATARIGRLATADDAGRPHVVPVCFALHEGAIVTPIDEKPKDAAPSDLRRVRDVEANSRVALVVDHYSEDWSQLGWLQVRGIAGLRQPEDTGHSASVETLREKYDQYRTHALAERSLIRIDPGHVVSWGDLTGGGPRADDR